MSSKLTKLTERLRIVEEELDAKATSLRAQLSEVEDSMSRVRAAIEHLCIEPAKPSRARKPKRVTPKTVLASEDGHAAVIPLTKEAATERMESSEHIAADHNEASAEQLPMNPGSESQSDSISRAA